MKIEPKEKPWVTWPHFSLWERVHDALLAAPGYFKSDILITGVPATDLQNLNTLLGATIEDRVVDTLNSMRSVWDPESKYMDYAFVRQPQTFPDVLLRRTSDGDEAADYLRVSVDTIDHQQVDAARARGRVGVTARPAVPVVAGERSARPGFRVRAGGHAPRGAPGRCRFNTGGRHDRLVKRPRI